MLQDIPERTKRLFLLKFTEELIRNYKPMDLYKLKEKVKIEERRNAPFFPSVLQSSKETKKEIRELVKEKLSEKPKEKTSESINSKIQFKTKLPRHIISQESVPVLRPFVMTKDTRVLRIPESRLPERFNYLRPAITYEKLNLGKIGVLVSDPNVETIECPGENQKVVVEGSMGRKPTGTILNKTEIDQVLSEFSKQSKIPIGEGITKVAAGGLTLTAIISENEKHFIIKKIKENKFLMPPRPLY